MRTEGRVGGGGKKLHDQWKTSYMEEDMYNEVYMGVCQVRRMGGELVKGGV